MVKGTEHAWISLGTPLLPSTLNKGSHSQRRGPSPRCQVSLVPSRQEEISPVTHLVNSFQWTISFSSGSGCRWPGRSVRVASTPSPHAVVGREPLRVPCSRAFEGGQMCHGVASLCIVCWLSKFSVVDTGRPSTSLLSTVPGHRNQNSLIKSRTSDHLCPESINYSYTSKHLQTQGKKLFIFSMTCLQHPIVPMVQMKFLGVHRSEETARGHKAIKWSHLKPVLGCGASWTSGILMKGGSREWLGLACATRKM